MVEKRVSPVLRLVFSVRACECVCDFMGWVGEGTGVGWSRQSPGRLTHINVYTTILRCARTYVLEVGEVVGQD